MKRLISLFISAIILALCPSCGYIIEGTPVENSGEVKGSLSMFGSSSMTKVMNGLGEGYKNSYSGVTFSVGGQGSSDAVPSVLEGTALIGMLSRNLLEGESQDKVEQVLLAYDGLVIVVNNQNRVDNLTKEQAHGIFTGSITNWKEVGGDDAAIITMGRDEASGSREAFESILEIGDGEAVYRSVYDDNSKIRLSVSENKYSVGYISISAADGSVKSLNFEGVAPTEETIANQTYELWRPFLLVHKKGSTNPVLESFLEYIRTDEARGIISSNGVIPAL